MTIAGPEHQRARREDDLRPESSSTFDATAKQPQRSLAPPASLRAASGSPGSPPAAAGSAAQGVSWQTGAGRARRRSSTRDDAIAVKNLKLVNGDQQIAADGTFGRPGDALKVTLNNVDLASVDALLLRPPQFTGRLNATGDDHRHQGRAATSRPTSRSTQGGFRQFRYDIVQRHGGLRGQGRDARHQAAAEPDDLAHGEGLRADRAVQGRRAAERAATQAVGRRRGPHRPARRQQPDRPRARAGVHDGADQRHRARCRRRSTSPAPPPIRIRPAPITVAERARSRSRRPASATRNLDGRIDLQPDSVHIDEITVLDNHQKPLSITGDLAIHELAGRRRADLT